MILAPFDFVDDRFVVAAGDNNFQVEKLPMSAGEDRTVIFGLAAQTNDFGLKLGNNPATFASSCREHLGVTAGIEHGFGSVVFEVAAPKFPRVTLRIDYRKSGPGYFTFYFDEAVSIEDSTQASLLANFSGGADAIAGSLGRSHCREAAGSTASAFAVPGPPCISTHADPAGIPMHAVARSPHDTTATCLLEQPKKGFDLEHVPHPYIASRKKQAEEAASSKPTGFNNWIAVKITNVVGTMWCAYGFTILALVSLPDAIKGGRSQLVAWIAQTFLQLVLLSIIMVGQKVASTSSDRQARQTYEDAEVLLQLSDDIHKLLKQNTTLTEQIDKLLRQPKQLSEH